MSTKSKSSPRQSTRKAASRKQVASKAETPMPEPSKPLPATLARNAAKVAERARAANEERARELVALVRDKLRTASSAFYDIGVALAQLAEPALYAALGYTSFASMVRAELGFSNDKAREWIAVARGLKRNTALALGPSRAAAVVELAKATAEHDTPEEVAQGEVVVRGRRKPVRPKDLSAREIARAAAAVRRSQRAKSPVDDDDQAWLERVIVKLRKLDPHARARFVTLRRKGESVTRAGVIEASVESLRRVLGR
jgi:hypothetical protein